LNLPTIIQGGMGIAVSDWRLARAVASHGQLGVVSGTALDHVLVRRLQLGDPEGHIRRALSHFPDQAVATRIVAKYFVEGGIPQDQRFAIPPMWRVGSPPETVMLSVAGSFVEVWLAREGHGGPVGINLLEKIQLPNTATLWGAMLAGVDFILMGAGIPSQIPGMLDKLALHQRVAMRLAVENDAPDATAEEELDPAKYLPNLKEPLKRPNFLAIISSATLAQALIKRVTGRLDGFVVEHHTAGGHNAPPRGQSQRNERGEPIYSTRDEMDFAKLVTLGLPFWVAGGAASPENLAAAMALGAVGIQVGTAFAFCEESGVDPAIRRAVLEKVRQGKGQVFTDPTASPTGFPFKVVPLAGTVSEDDCYLPRERICDVGLLRKAYRREDGTVGYRCPAEPENIYLAKGGCIEDTVGRKCLCNGLLATVGLGQRRGEAGLEPAIVTAGDDLARMGCLLREDAEGYTVADVLQYLFSAMPVTAR